MKKEATYDLEERTTKLGTEILIFCKSLNLDTISRSIISQIVRSGTSIGANYMEANNASSKKDFQNKIFICKKECQETEYWLKMMDTCYPEKKKDLDEFKVEVHELTMIFQKITNTLRNGNSKNEKFNEN